MVEHPPILSESIRVVCGDGGLGDLDACQGNPFVLDLKYFKQRTGQLLAQRILADRSHETLSIRGVFPDSGTLFFDLLPRLVSQYCLKRAFMQAKLQFSGDKPQFMAFVIVVHAGEINVGSAKNALRLDTADKDSFTANQ